MSNDLQERIARAVAEGKVTRIEAGKTALARKPLKEDRLLVHPITCGHGTKRDRMPMLDEGDE